jgi:hypothetical protein
MGLISFTCAKLAFAKANQLLQTWQSSLFF